MKVQEAIDMADSVKPNGYGNADKVAWLAELEGKIQTEIFLLPLEKLERPESVTDELIVPFPYDSIYNFWLQAMIDFHNGEYDKYDNTFAMFNEKWKDYEKWRTINYPTVGSLRRGETRVGKEG